MIQRWDWSADPQFVSWAADLVGVKVGLAVSEEDLRRVIARYDHVLPDSAAQKVARELLGRSLLEHYGLEGAMRALQHPLILAVQTRVDDYALAKRALAFVFGHVFRPSAEADYL